MQSSFFVSDLHGSTRLYQTLFERIRIERPRNVFMGGDLLPGGTILGSSEDFIGGFFVVELGKLESQLGADYPSIFVILGNDDPRTEELSVLEAAAKGVFEYVHDRRVQIEGFTVYGYSYVPPSPFLLKDWEKYDVSRQVDPGCVSPEEGIRSVPVSDSEVRYTTIKHDLDLLAANRDLSNSVFLFHTPPYGTNLDRAGLDGKMIDHVPLDVHVGSIAVKRFIEERQPLVTLHGHVHESPRNTGNWRDQIGRTHLFSAAHDGPELSLVRFDLEEPGAATRELI